MAETNATPKRWLLISGAPVQQALWKPLSERYDLCFIYDGVVEYAGSLGVTADNLNRYITADVQEAALTEAAKLAAKAVPAMPVIQQRLTARFNGNTPTELAEADTWFPGYLLQKAQVTAMMIGALELFLKTHDVAGCVVHEDVAPDMRTIVALCRARGIPTIHLPHAPCHLLPNGDPDIHRETRADWIGASGPGVAEFYRENGHAPDKIAVLGGAQWDGLYTPFIHVERNEARRVLGIDPDRLALWYGASWTQTTALRGEGDVGLRNGLIAVISTAKKLDAFLMITLHPNDGSQSDDMYLQALHDFEADGLVTRYHVPYIAAAADALIAQGPSNLCIDAAIQGVPSCYLQTEGFDFRSALPYRSDGSDLTAIVQQTIASRGSAEWQAFVRLYNAAHPDGDAAGQIAAWVGDLCR